jgi:DNA-binding beta-propeller fold protein YncE
MKSLRNLVGACLSVALLAACDGRGSDVSSVQPTIRGVAGRPAVEAARPTNSSLSTLYVADSNHSTVTVYASGSTRELRTISMGVSRPSALAVDPNGDLYVANRGNNTVTVYAPGSTSLLRVMSEGMSAPAALAISPFSGNLYVANSSNNTVTVYAPGHRSLLRTISEGVQAPVTLAISPYSGNLYLANAGHKTVTVYADSGSSLRQTISQGVTRIPHSLAFDRLGSLYLANTEANTVTVYGCLQHVRAADDLAGPGPAIRARNQPLFRRSLRRKRVPRFWLRHGLRAG